ncbi:hypothetical protein FQA39_LY06435 [Lamprigera yunnana]|nr:hypothetical protein FQA39_LY06435 [Lamprigera yunnana]
MEKSKLPVNVQSKIPSASKGPLKKAADENRFKLRKSKSCSDFKNLLLPKKPTSITASHLQLNLIPSKARTDKPIKTTVHRLGAKRPAVEETPSVPIKTARPAKIPPYDYKARYNAEVEKITTLRADLKEKQNLLQHIHVEHEDLLQKHQVATDKLSHLQETQRENLALKSERIQLHNELAQLRTDLKLLNQKVVNIEEENTRLLITNKTYEGETEKLKYIVNDLTKENMQISPLKNHLQNLESERRIMHNQIQDLKGKIRVFCRVRPQLPSEYNKSLCNFTYVNEDTLEIRRTKDTSSSIKSKSMETIIEFEFDKVFDPGCTQLEVFEELSHLIQSAIDGFNVCVFTYGQTGSGKTFTILGEDNEDKMGIIPRTVNLVFKLIDNYKVFDTKFTVVVSFLEIYNETIRDLLEVNSNKHLEVRYNDGKGTTVTNLLTKCVNSASELFDLMNEAAQNRAVAVTNFNEHSSRSHCVTKITLSRKNEGTQMVNVSSISLVDLAGSECAKTSERIEETKCINKSLSALGAVINALQNKENHIPYRNSKLTYLLQSSLGGNSKTLMFVNVAPLEEWYNESVNALRFATMLKTSVRNNFTIMVRKLKFHEQKLLKKVDFISWEVDNNIKKVKILKKYYIQKQEDYSKYNKLARSIRELGRKIKEVDPKHPFRTHCSAQLLEKLYVLGLIQTKWDLGLVEGVSAASFCRRRLPVVMVRNRMSEHIKGAVKLIEQGHVRVGPELVTDPAFLVTRTLEDFVTWVDTSKIRKHILEYNGIVTDSIATSCIQLAKEQIIKYSDQKYNINDLKTRDCETMLLNQTIYYLNKSKSKWISVGLYCPFKFASVVKIFGRSKQYVIFKEEEWIQFHEQRENINKYFQTFDTIWKPRQIGSKSLTFEMIKEKKILKIEDMSGNEVYLGWESVSEVWSLESVLSYILSYSSEIQFIKKMWMLYAEHHWTKAVDLKSAVERLYEKQGALEFDADHEAIYGMERYYTVQQCEERRDKY